MHQSKMAWIPPGSGARRSQPTRRMWIPSNQLWKKRSRNDLDSTTCPRRASSCRRVSQIRPRREGGQVEEVDSCDRTVNVAVT